MEDTEVQRDALQAQLTTVNTQLDAMSTERNDLHARRLRNKQKKIDLRASEANLASQKAVLQQENTTKDQQIVQLHAQLQDLQNQLAAARLPVSSPEPSNKASSASVSEDDEPVVQVKEVPISDAVIMERAKALGLVKFSPEVESAESKTSTASIAMLSASGGMLLASGALVSYYLMALRPKLAAASAA